MAIKMMGLFSDGQCDCVLVSDTAQERLCLKWFREVTLCFPKTYTKVLTPDIYECDFIWK